SPDAPATARLEPGGDLVRHAFRRVPGAAHPVVRDLLVQGRPGFHEALQRAARIRRLQQRPHLVVAQPVPELPDRGIEPDHQRRLPHGTAIVRIEHRAAAGGDDHVPHPRQVREQLGLAPPEAGLALQVEDRRDRYAAAALQLAIHVDEFAPEQASQAAPDRGLAGAGHADEEDGALQPPARVAIGRKGGFVAHDDTAYWQENTRAGARPAPKLTRRRNQSAGQPIPVPNGPNGDWSPGGEMSALWMSAASTGSQKSDTAEPSVPAGALIETRSR